MKLWLLSVTKTLSCDKLLQVTYELADNQEFFAIDRYTGNITTLITFDREEQDFYNVKVIAMDNSPSALYTTGEHNKGT